MSRLIILTTLVIITFGSCKQQTESKATEKESITSVYYLIRHAEKDRSDPDNKDPLLTEEGEARAQRWSAYFDSISLDAVYSTSYNRTYSTARPTAGKKGIAVIPYNVQYIVSPAFKNDTRGKKVLVVGHSNTTPTLANSLMGSERFPYMDDNDNSSLYVVTITDSLADVQVRTVE